jgi:hypothetical protein
MKALRIFAMFCAFALSACAQESESHNQPVVQSGGNNLGIFDYRRLNYEEQGTCTSSSFYFRMLSVEDVNLGKNNGQDILADTDVLIHSNGRFEIEYKEKYIVEYTVTGYAYKRQRVRYASGVWKEEGGVLRLGDLMIVQANDENGKIQATVTYQKDLVTPGLNGIRTSAHMVLSSSAIRSQREVCPGPEDQLGLFDRFKARDSLSSIELKGFTNWDTFVTDDITVTNLALIIHPDGRYDLVARAKVPDVSFVWSYNIDSGIWVRQGNQLKLYKGSLRLSYNGAQLVFDRDPILFSKTGKAFKLSMSGQSIQMNFGGTPYNMDDLTDIYR